MKKILATTLIMAMGASVSVADILTINADGNDTTWRSNGSSVWVGQSTARVGGEQAGSYNSHVMPFLLPTLPVGHAISDVNITAIVDSTSNLDLVGEYVDIEGIRTSATSGTLATDVSGTVIANDLYELTAGFPTGTVIFGAGTAGFTSYIQGLYDAGKAGEYVFLSLTPGAVPANNSRYFTIQSGNGGTAPALNITTAIPEPATLGLIGAVAGAMIFIRRRFMI